MLPAASLPEQFTAVLPTGNVLPGAGKHVTVTAPSTRSLADASKLTAAPSRPVASRVMSVGRVNFGAVSCTVTMKLPLAVLPCASVAEQLMGVLPIGKMLPEPGEQLTAMVPSTRSLADVSKFTTAPACPV